MDDRSCFEKLFFLVSEIDSNYSLVAVFTDYKCKSHEVELICLCELLVSRVSRPVCLTALFTDGEPRGLDDEVISRLVEDAIDSESREILTLSRSRLVATHGFPALSFATIASLPFLLVACSFSLVSK